jgi:hypothetical protein
MVKWSKIVPASQLPNLPGNDDFGPMEACHFHGCLFMQKTSNSPIMKGLETKHIPQYSRAICFAGGSAGSATPRARNPECVWVTYFGPHLPNE